MYPAGTPRGECGPVRPFPHCIAEGLPLRVQAEARAHSCSRPRQTVPPPGGCGGLRCAAGGSYALPLHARVRAESAPRAQPSGSMPRRRGACTPVTPSQRAAQHVCAAARRARGRAGRRTRATPTRAAGGPGHHLPAPPPQTAPRRPVPTWRDGKEAAVVRDEVFQEDLRRGATIGARHRTSEAPCQTGTAPAPESHESGTGVALVALRLRVVGVCMHGPRPTPRCWRWHGRSRTLAGIGGSV